MHTSGDTSGTCLETKYSDESLETTYPFLAAALDRVHDGLVRDRRHKLDDGECITCRLVVEQLRGELEVQEGLV